MKCVRRLSIGSVVALSLSLSVVEAKPTFEKDGTVIFPGVDFTTGEGKGSTSFRATRWGMYDLMFEGTADRFPKATINGRGPIESPPVVADSEQT